MQGIVSDLCHIGLIYCYALFAFSKGPGSGFFARADVYGDGLCDVLVTNNHVLSKEEDAMRSTMVLHGQDTTIPLSDIVVKGSFRTSLKHEVSFFVIPYRSGKFWC